MAFRLPRSSLGGVEGYEAEQGIQFAGVQDQGARREGDQQAALQRPPVRRPLQVREGPHQGHGEDDHSGAVGAALPRRPQGHHARTSIRSLDAFFDDLAKTYKDAVAAFYKAAAAICSSTTPCGRICARRRSSISPSSAATIRPACPEIYARVINEAIKNRPSDMTITTHVCRGNFRSTWISEGGYEPVAEVLFGR